MTRQKLPDGICGPCEYGETSLGVIEDDDTEVSSFTASGRACIHVDDCACYASTALAVIRNAGADAVYEAAKRLVSDGPAAFAANFASLRTLIESSEDP